MNSEQGEIALSDNKSNDPYSILHSTAYWELSALYTYKKRYNLDVARAMLNSTFDIYRPLHKNLQTLTKLETSRTLTITKIENS